MDEHLPNLIGEAEALLEKHQRLMDRLSAATDTLRPAVETGLDNVRNQAAQLLGRVANDEALFELELRLDTEMTDIDDMHNDGILTEEQAASHKEALRNNETFRPIKIFGALGNLSLNYTVETNIVQPESAAEPAPAAPAPDEVRTQRLIGEVPEPDAASTPEVPETAESVQDELFPDQTVSAQDETGQPDHPGQEADAAAKTKESPVEPESLAGAEPTESSDTAEMKPAASPDVTETREPERIEPTAAPANRSGRRRITVAELMKERMRDQLDSIDDGDDEAEAGSADESITDVPVNFTLSAPVHLASDLSMPDVAGLLSNNAPERITEAIPVDPELVASAEAQNRAAQEAQERDEGRYRVIIEFTHDAEGNEQLQIGDMTWPLINMSYNSQFEYAAVRKRALELVVAASHEGLTTQSLRKTLQAEQLVPDNERTMTNVMNNVRQWLLAIYPTGSIPLIDNNKKRGATAKIFVHQLYAPYFAGQEPPEFVEVPTVNDVPPAQAAPEPAPTGTETESAESPAEADTAEIQASREMQRSHALKLLAYLDMYRDLLASYDVPPPKPELIDQLVQQLPADDQLTNGEALNYSSIIEDRKESARMFRAVFSDEALFNQFANELEPEDPLSDACSYLVGLREVDWAVISGLIDARVETRTTFRRSENDAEEVRDILFVITMPNGTRFERKVTGARRTTRPTPESAGIDSPATADTKPADLAENEPVDLQADATESDDPDEDTQDYDEQDDEDDTDDFEMLDSDYPMKRAAKRSERRRLKKGDRKSPRVEPEKRKMPEYSWQREITQATGNILDTLERLGVLENNSDIQVSRLAGLTRNEMPRLTDKVAFERMQRAGLIRVPARDALKNTMLTMTEVVLLDLLKIPKMYQHFNGKQSSIALQTVTECINKYFAKRAEQ